MVGAGAPVRRRLRVTGTVQGVGFRPFVYRHAVALGLTGWVRNDSAGVLVEVEGDEDTIAELARRLVDDAPPLARVTSVVACAVPVEDVHHAAFEIHQSHADGPVDVPVSVDTATCADCLAEMCDPADRRYRYPFTNCTNCGPRYTIVVSVPYDRPATTMAPFAMCPACQHEYDDPADRRFHAQPNACPVCGPRLRWCGPDGRVRSEGDAALDAAVTALGAGSVLAVKGLGGYHLAVDATDAAAVAELRRRKARDDKPFAVMVADIAAAAALCTLDDVALAALGSVRRPIVLAPRRPGPALAGGVAPGLPDLGVMLPYTPMHHLLLAGVGRPLVMTSGNLSDDPIAHDDADAVARLGSMVDGILTHDRRIHIRCDDSVVRGRGGRLQSLRRSRGYAPEPMALPVAARRPVLAVGAELKNTVAVAKGPSVVLSHHIGDLEHLATYRSFLQAIDHLCHLCGAVPEVVAHDLHPEYLSTKLSYELDLPRVAVQHHHAHIASCMAEHGRTEPVLGLAFDGLGYGTDGTLWGGEFLLADLTGFRRVGHLLAVPMPGGAAAVRQPWRMAVSWMERSLGADEAARRGSTLDPRTPALLALIDSGTAPLTSSMGRLFDGLAALLGVRSRVTYEAQAAIELEAWAANVPRSAAPDYPTTVDRSRDVPILDPSPLVAAVVADMDAGVDRSLIAAGIHQGLGAGAVALATDVARAEGVDTVALSGGVFQNARLTDVIEQGLHDQGLRVLVHELVPTNDGGISLGQAAVAAATEASQA